MSQNESAAELMGDEVLAKIARDLRSSIKRLLVLHTYPPDKQPEAIELVIEQMEAMAPRYVQGKKTG